MSRAVQVCLTGLLLCGLFMACGTTRKPPEPARPSRPSGQTLAWPVRGEILSRFGAPRPGRVHNGLDIRGRSGEPVRAAAAGRVSFSGSMRGYGKTVILEHGSGLETLYAHNRQLLVKVGHRVSRQQTIATVGRSGNATTDHCHFEVRQDRVAVDPLRYLK